MEDHIKENGRMIKDMDMVFINGLMVMFLKVLSLMEKDGVKVH